MKSMISQQGDDTAAAKQSLRHTMRRLREQLPRERAQAAAHDAADNLLRFLEGQEASTVALYAATGNELCPRAAASRLRERGVSVAFPRVLPGSKALQFHRVDELDALAPGAFGILEPAAAAPPVSPTDIDVIVVPGLAFDRLGYRLGWGQGYYDATLAGVPGLRIGFAHHCQVVDAVPRTDHDVAMDVLITDVAIVHTGARLEPAGRRDE